MPVEGSFQIQKTTGRSSRFDEWLESDTFDSWRLNSDSILQLYELLNDVNGSYSTWHYPR